VARGASEAGPEAAARECRFCRIASGDAPGLVVFEDAVSMAFLDSRPLFPGHCLLIPRAHHETLPDMPAPLVGPLFANARLLARAVQEALGADGTFVAVNNRVSQSVPHLHVHVVPRRHGDGLRGFFWPRSRYEDPQAAARVQAAVRAAVAALRAREP
jgi:histidine triad (HIT) family protein